MQCKLNILHYFICTSHAPKIGSKNSSIPFPQRVICSSTLIYLTLQHQVECHLKISMFWFPAATFKEKLLDWRLKKKKMTSYPSVQQRLAHSQLLNFCLSTATNLKLFHSNVKRQSNRKWCTYVKWEEWTEIWKLWHADAFSPLMSNNPPSKGACLVNRATTATCFEWQKNQHWSMVVAASCCEVVLVQMNGMKPVETGAEVHLPAQRRP